MDYSTFYPQQQTYPNLTTANLQNIHTNNTPFQLNPSPPITQPVGDQCPNHQNNISPLQQNNISPLQQNSIQPLQAGNLAQLQANMFFMDPFDTKVDTQANDLDHGSYSSTLPPLCPCMYVESTYLQMKVMYSWMNWTISPAL